MRKHSLFVSTCCTIALLRLRARGWDESNPNEVGCILLSEYSEDNLVVENLFPEGTSASNQILDVGHNNNIVGRFKGEQ
jgi:hypothetical protein